MKIGLHYSSYNDCAYILYALHNNNLTVDEKNQYFELIDGEDSYLFSTNYNNLKDCDKKIKLFHQWADKDNIQHYYDKLIQSQPGESMPYYVTDLEVLDFLNDGNICLSGGSLSFKHENLFFEPILAIYYFYYTYGFEYLNYYKFSKKNNLLGMYHKKTHIGNRNIPMRNFIYDATKEILDNDLHAYQNSEYNLRKLIQPYTFFGNWGQNHISSYIDYTTSVCNIIYETYDSYRGPGGAADGRIHLTEKTLKSILFCNEDIFFIWYGPDEFYKYLTDLNFWFLNSEFYDNNFQNVETNYEQFKIPIQAIENSVIQSAKYLKTLKNQLGDNTKVYNFLMEKYGDKLKNNTKIFSSLLEGNVDKKREILNLVKK